MKTPQHSHTVLHTLDPRGLHTFHGMISSIWDNWIQSCRLL